MNLDSQMIVSLLNFVKILNVKFRSSDITDATRKQLKPLMENVDDDCMSYVKLLRKPGNISTTKELQDFRKISKEIRLSTNDTIVEKTSSAVDFIKTQIDENDSEDEPEIVEDESSNETDSTDESVTDTEEAGDSSTDEEDMIIADSNDSTTEETEEEEITDTDENEEPAETDEDIASTDESVDVDADDSTDGNG